MVNNNAKIGYMNTHFQLSKIVIGIFSIVLLSVLFLIALDSVRASIQLADGEDIFEIYSPTPNATLKGGTEVKFKLYDDDVATLDYDIKLFDVTCNETYFGNIAAGKVESSQSAVNVINWDTKRTSTQSNLSDGFYCVQICTVFQADLGPYSACNARYVYLANNNVAPTITSNPEKTDFFLGETFSYDLNASDADGDAIIYRIVNAPGGFTINPSSGLVTSSVLNTLGTFTITVSASDSINPAVNQTFTYSVIEPEEQTEDTDDEIVEPPLPPEEEETPAQEEGSINDVFIEIDRPRASEVFSSNRLIISWFLDEVDPVDSVKIEYSADLSNWTEIASGIEPARTYYVWNIAEVMDETYYLRIVISDSQGNEAQQTSPAFTIEKNQDQEISTGLVASNIIPADGEEYAREELAEITFDLTPSDQATIIKDSVSVIIDGVVITDLCTANESGTSFSCEPYELLDAGNHVLRIEAEDSSEQTLIREITFRIAGEDTNQPPVDNDEEGVLPDTESTGSVNYLLIALIVSAVVVFLAIPWLILRVGLKKEVSVKETRADVPSKTNNYTNTQQTQPVPPGNYVAPFNPNVPTAARPVQPPINNNHVGRTPLDQDNKRI